MGDPKKRRKTFESPKKRWDKDRILEEADLRKQYGLRSKKEIWKMETKLRKIRQNARKLLALPVERREKREAELMGKLHRQGLLEREASLEDVLTMNVNSVAERRLQTLVWRKDLSLTPNQSRQIIVHGHIGINKVKTTAPGHLVTRDEEEKISWFKKPLKLKQVTKKDKEKLKKKFEEAIPEEEKKKEAEQKSEKTENAEKTEETKEKEKKEEDKKQPKQAEEKAKDDKEKEKKEEKVEK